MHSKFEYAVSLFQNGELEKANKECLEILKNEPSNSEILHLIGIIYFKQKEYTLSIYHIQKSINVNPENAEANHNLGIVLKELKKFDESLKSFNKAVKINPNYSDAYNNIGIVLKELGKHDAAMDSWKKIIEIKPNYIHAYNNIGNCLLELKNHKSAIDYYDKAISIDNKFCEAYLNKGNALQELALHNEAIKCYDNAIGIKSNYAEAYFYKGNSLKEVNLFDEAIKEYSSAFNINPELKNLFGTLVFTKHNICNWDNYNKDLEFLEKEILKEKVACKPFSILSIFDSPSLQRISAEINIKNKYKSIDAFKKVTVKNKSKKIRIGYYSADFRNHAMSLLLVKMFELHNKSEFETFAFSFGPEKNDDMKKRISLAFDKFIEVNHKTDEEIAKLSRQLDINIAIDLMGFTKWNRFGIFENKCAPIQINYLGYPGTLGSKNIDYIISDKFLIPKSNQKYYSEKIIYLPNSYQVRDFTQKISKKKFTKEELGLPKNSFVFCCFNNHYKLTPSIFSIWMNILKKVNNSVLWLVEGNIKTSENLKKEANLKGINPDRIIFARKVSMEEHLSRHSAADLFIDTYPYGAHTTCSDSLWAGLPVVTLIGQTFASRVAGSILSAMDMSELVTHTKNEYENLILDLSKNYKKLNEIKNKLNKNRLARPFFDTKIYTKNLEKAYKNIYEKNLKNNSVENIEI